MCPVPVDRRNWPFLRTPLAVYLVVMGPIAGLMLFLFFNVALTWMRWSAAAVLALTAFGFLKGYVRKLVLTDQSARMVRLFSNIEIPWSRIRRVGIYVPGGGVGTTEYVYLTTHEDPPAGKWEIDADTIQLQNRPELLETIELMRKQSGELARRSVNSIQPTR